MTKPAITRRSLGALLVALRPPQTAQSDLGTLTPFYRATQLQGIFFGMGLAAIPQYLLDPDVDPKYRRNPALKTEIPFLFMYLLSLSDMAQNVNVELGTAMARNKVQFQKGLSEADFDILYGTEEKYHHRAAFLLGAVEYIEVRV